ncbi:PI-PLC X domain-containing protein 1-like [Channa argus]|uniref:PI-PLC X domain-containing protein 1-like n=1 Tax=Channa argus TaxID=215402 RepID=UPI0035226273
MFAKGKGKEKATSYCDWMSQLPPELHDIPLFNLAIPGSHDSMSYDLDINSSIAEPDKLKKFSKIYCARKIILKWGATQNVLRDFNMWAERHHKEILILAFSHFKGFDKKTEEQLHTHLINFIKSLFGTKVLHRGTTPTLRSCWDQGRNIIVSYDYHAYQHPEIWTKIPYFYGNSMKPAKVESKLSQVLEKERPSQCFFVCGLNLTLPEDASILKYILRLCDNFANVVRRSLPRLLQWLKLQASKKPNIVASDLATCEDFVSTVIQLNISK